MEPPFVEIYSQLVNDVNELKGVEAYSASQDIETAELPIVRVQLLNGDGTNQYQNAREYSYPFQLDVVTEQTQLVKGLKLAYQIMQLCRKLTIPDFSVYLNGEPQLSSMVDSSTNRILNRQIIRVNYNVIEDTAF